jgi:hypothetical protein
MPRILKYGRESSSFIDTALLVSDVRFNLHLHMRLLYLYHSVMLHSMGGTIYIVMGSELS